MSYYPKQLSVPENSASDLRALTTGQAAKLCSVNMDTVLKWIKKGRLRATRTPGGHYRISVGDLQFALKPNSAAPSTRSSDSQQEPNRALVRCWEYYAHAGNIQAECKSCVVYGIRASWCFKVGTPGCELGQAKHYCRVPCDECFYYQRVTGKKPKVLTITPDAEWIEQLVVQDPASLEMGYARSGYEASATLCSFRPAFVIVDEVLLSTTEAHLLDVLGCDSRLHGAKIILAIGRTRGRKPRETPWMVAGVLEKPVLLTHIEAVVFYWSVELLTRNEPEEPGLQLPGGA